MLDVNNDTENEGKYKVEDNFWLFMGLKGNSENQKVSFILSKLKLLGGKSIHYQSRSSHL
jgi:hypothetical protein